MKIDISGKKARYTYKTGFVIESYSIGRIIRDLILHNELKSDTLVNHQKIWVVESSSIQINRFINIWIKNIHRKYILRTREYRIAEQLESNGRGLGNFSMVEIYDNYSVSIMAF